MCRCVWDIDILYDYYKRNMSLTEDEAIALFNKAQAKNDQGDYKGIRKYLPKDNNICFWLTQYIMFFFMVILSGWIIPPIMLIASAMSAPFSAVLSKSPITRRFPFVTEDFFEKIPFAGLITSVTTNTFFLTIYQKLIEMLICSSASVQSTAVANNSTVVFNSSTTMFNNSTGVMSTSTTVVATMAVHDNVICWGPTHQLYASIALGLLIFLVPTATVIGSQFMESKSDEETVYLFFKSKASSVRWTPSFQL